MGGYLSNRWPAGYRRRCLITEAMELPIGRMGLPLSANATGTYYNGSLIINTGEDGGELVTLSYGIEQRFPLILQPIGQAGYRWNVVCECGQKRTALYRKPNRERWACRVCHQLVYDSEMQHKSQFYHWLAPNMHRECNMHREL